VGGKNPAPPSDDATNPGASLFKIERWKPPEEKEECTGAGFPSTV